ncbi:MAG: hypothetical protein RLZZ324_41 [Candidatus Parcubacteria bacterium]
MLELFLITNVWLFWGFVALDVIIAATCVYRKHFVAAWLAFIGGLGVMSLLKMFDAPAFLHFVISNPLGFVLNCACIFGIISVFGLLYATYRLRKLILSRKATFAENRVKYAENVVRAAAQRAKEEEEERNRPAPRTNEFEDDRSGRRGRGSERNRQPEPKTTVPPVLESLEPRARVMAIADFGRMNDIGFSERTQQQTVLIRHYAGEIASWIAYWWLFIIGYVVADLLTDAAHWVYTQVSGAYQRMADKLMRDA